MYADITKPPAPLPQPQVSRFGHGLTLLAPLSRRGTVPGLVILTPPQATDDAIDIVGTEPSPIVKWAEEGYTVIQVAAVSLETSSVTDILRNSLDALEKHEKCQPKNAVGLISYGAELWNAIAPHLREFSEISVSIVYASERDYNGLAFSSTPILRHIAGKQGKPPLNTNSGTLVEYFYTQVESHNFAFPSHEDFHYSTDAVAHTRNLQFLKPRMNGPYFDLESIWEEHTYYEFADRSVEHTMSTMVQEPYVNHIPVLTGGIGRPRLTDFYRNNFIFNNSADTELDLVSRTVGIDRVIDEFVFKFTHDREIDWLLPGVPPTFRKAEIPFVAVVNIRGDRLYHEHITWDQGTVLRQLGLMPEYLPFPFPINQKKAQDGHYFEYHVPVAGIETARKLQDRNAVESNEMFGFKIREAKND